MSEQARIALTIRGNTFEISGPEGFVTAQVAAFREAIISSLKVAADSSPENPPAETQLPPGAAHHKATGKQPYTKVLHIDGEKVQILKSVSGTTKSKKAVGTSLIYLWAKRASGVHSVPFSELRDLCQHHGCLDAANFSSTLKKAIEWIVVEGEKGSPAQTCKLTIPGVERAEEILKELNGEKGA
jgi:hypothetical protein